MTLNREILETIEELLGEASDILLDLEWRLGKEPMICSSEKLSTELKDVINGLNLVKQIIEREAKVAA